MASAVPAARRRRSVKSGPIAYVASRAQAEVYLFSRFLTAEICVEQQWRYCRALTLKSLGYGSPFHLRAQRHPLALMSHLDCCLLRPHHRMPRLRQPYLFRGKLVENASASEKGIGNRFGHIVVCWEVDHLAIPKSAELKAATHPCLPFIPG